MPAPEDGADDAAEEPQEFEVTLCVSRRHFPVQLRIWNYNRPNCETDGVKDLSIEINGRDVWRGQVPKVSAAHHAPRRPWLFSWPHVV